LWVMQVAVRATPEHRLRQEPFSPQGNEPARVEVFRMHRPETHMNSSLYDSFAQHEIFVPIIRLLVTYYTAIWAYNKVHEILPLIYIKLPNISISFIFSKLKLTIMPKRKLLDQIRDAIRVKHNSMRTEEAYGYWIKKYLMPCNLCFNLL